MSNQVSKLTVDPPHNTTVTITITSYDKETYDLLTSQSAFR